MVSLVPGKTYETDEFKYTEKVLEEILARKIKLRSTEDLKKTLDEEGVEYEEVVCKQCGGRAVKLEFHPVKEVV